MTLERGEDPDLLDEEAEVIADADGDGTPDAGFAGQGFGPVAVVTGASRGIGRSLADALEDAGFIVERGSTAVAPVTDPEAVATWVADVLDRQGRIDLLVNNAVYQDRESNALLAQLDDDALQRTLWGNVVAPFHLVRRLLPAMVAQGGGQIVNISSGAGKADPPVPADQGAWGYAYGASKAAMARLAGCINVEYGAKGVRAFSVNPGLVSTEAVTATLGDGGLLEQRYGAMKPQAIAAGLVWLATDPRAAALAADPMMIDLQDVVRAHGIGG